MRVKTTRNKSDKQRQKEEVRKMGIKQTMFNTVSLEGLNEKRRGKRGSYNGESNKEMDVLDRIHFKRNVINGYDLEDDSIEALMMPDKFKSAGGTGCYKPVINEEVQAKINKMFGAEKFAQQAENMHYYFRQGLTIYEIAWLCLGDEATETQLATKAKSVNRSIQLGEQKVLKNISLEQWNLYKNHFQVIA